MVVEGAGALDRCVRVVGAVDDQERRYLRAAVGQRRGGVRFRWESGATERRGCRRSWGTSRGTARQTEEAAADLIATMRGLEPGGVRDLDPDASRSARGDDPCARIEADAVGASVGFECANEPVKRVFHRW